MKKYFFTQIYIKIHSGCLHPKGLTDNQNIGQLYFLTLSIEKCLRYTINLYFCLYPCLRECNKPILKEKFRSLRSLSGVLKAMKSSNVRYLA